MPPDAIETYLNNGAANLAAADHWLATVIPQPQDVWLLQHEQSQGAIALEITLKG